METANNKRVFEPVAIEFISEDGLQLKADSWGDPSNPPVIMLHGGGQTRHAWGNTGRKLAEFGWYAISLDMRGHGESAWSVEGNYGLRPMVNDLVTLTSKLQHKPVFVGASMGGMTALMAQGYLAPGLGQALVLVDIAPRMESKGVARIVDFMRAHQKGFATLEEAADAVAGYRQQRGRPTDINGLRKNLRLREDGRYYWHWDPQIFSPKDPSVMRDYGKLHEAARALDVPTLLVKGKHSDVVSEASVREFMTLVPHAEFVDVSGAGHMVAGENNDEFCAAILDFLERNCRKA